MIYSLLDESGMVVSHEPLDDTLVLWLDMCSKVWLEVFSLNVLKIGRNNVARKVILQEKYFSVLCLEFLIPLLNLILIEMGGHPGFCIVLVVEPQLCTCLLFECSRACCFPDNEWREFLSDPSAFDVKVYINLFFFSLTHDCL